MSGQRGAREHQPRAPRQVNPRRHESAGSTSSEFLRFATADAAGTSVLGQQILALFGILVGSFRIAGGIVTLNLALSMLHAQPSGVHGSAQEEDAGRTKDNPAVFPVAIPMIAGPESMATVILYAQHARGAPGAATIG